MLIYTLEYTHMHIHITNTYTDTDSISINLIQEEILPGMLETKMFLKFLTFIYIFRK